MNYCQLTSLITGIANSLAGRLSTDQLNLLGAILSQLGDTLETIAAHQSICSGQSNSDSF